MAGINGYNPLDLLARQMWMASHPQADDSAPQQAAASSTPSFTDGGANSDLSGIIGKLVALHLQNMMQGAAPAPEPGPAPSDPRIPGAGLYNSPVAANILGAYGIAQPAPNPFMLFGNRPGSFGARHPRIAGALEGALSSVANMGPSDGTVGGAIGQVARGVMGYQQNFRENLANQYEIPFKEAAQLQALQAGLDVHAERVHQLAQEPLDTAYKLAHIQDWLTAHQDTIHNLYSDVKVGADGYPYGINRRTGKYERVPTPSNVQFHVPGEAGGLQAEIMNNVMSSDPAIRAKGQKQLALWTQMYGAQAGARWGAIPGQVSEADKLAFETERARLTGIINKKPWDMMLSGEATDFDDAVAKQNHARKQLEQLRPPSPYGQAPSAPSASDGSQQDDSFPQPIVPPMKPKVNQTPIPTKKGGSVGNSAAPAPSAGPASSGKKKGSSDDLVNAILKNL